jgi:hypothetical protein
MTVQELVNYALQDIGVLDPGETPSATESNHAFALLNDLLSNWSAQAAPIYEITRDTITLTGAASYAVSTRPVKIKSAAILQGANMTYPAEVLDAAGWAAIPDKLAIAPHPRYAYYEDGYPNGRLHLAPVPATGGTVVLYAQKTMGAGGLFDNREGFALTGASSYTVGFSGNFVTERPAKLTSVEVQAVTAATKGLKIVDASDWAAFSDKGTQSLIADVLYYDGSFSAPTVYVAPKPAAGTLELYVYRALTALGSLGATISLPPGYGRAMRATLALELANGYGSPITTALQSNADDARASIFGLNQAVLGSPGAPPIEAPKQ